jgi:hypothetical protein
MLGIREFLSNALGNGFEWIAYIALAIGILLIIVAIVSISREHKDPLKFLFSLTLGGFLIWAFLWVVQPLGLFSGQTFSK